VAAVRDGLAALADPAKAGGMRAYLKSELPCLGVYTAEQRRLQRDLFGALPLGSVADWQATVLGLWQGAGYREERYAAIGLVLDRRYEAYLTPQALPLLEHLVVSGAWWDLVDPLATHGVRGLLERHPAAIRPRVLAWSTAPDLWLRRASIICQVGRKGDTELDLLHACIEPNLADRDFFIRKAIGWALRDYAWHDPREVDRYVREHEDRLSALSRREATKNLARLLS